MADALQATSQFNTLGSLMRNLRLAWYASDSAGSAEGQPSLSQRGAAVSGVRLRRTALACLLAVLPCAVSSSQAFAAPAAAHGESVGSAAATLRARTVADAILAREFGPGAIITEMEAGASGYASFKAVHHGECWHLKVPARPFAPDNSVEVANFRWAAAHGFAPRVIYHDPETCLLVTELVDGAPITRDLLEARPALRARVMHRLAALHRLPAFADAADAPAGEVTGNLLGRVEALRGHADPQVAGMVGRFLERRLRLREALAEHPVPLGMCHGDFHPGNILLTGDDVLFIDWVAMGRNDPFMDLARFASLSGVPMTEAETLLQEYLQRPSLPAEVAALQIRMALIDLEFYAVMLAVPDGRQRSRPFGERVRAAEDHLPHLFAPPSMVLPPY
jgi:thiamine kinase-like enzyme